MIDKIDPDYTRIADRVMEDPLLFANHVINELKSDKTKITRAKFKQKWEAGLADSEVSWSKKYMTDKLLNIIYDNSGRDIKDSKSKDSYTEIDNKRANKTKTKRIKQVKRENLKTIVRTIRVSRYGKTYSRAITPRWEKKTNFALEKTALLKSGSKQYKTYIANIIKSTGRSKQAVVKKVQRTRQKLKKGGKK